MTEAIATPSGYAILNPIVKARTAARRLASTPPHSTANRTRLGADANPPGTEGSSSPNGRTNAPNGIQFRVISVPCQVNSFTKPRGKSEAEFLHFDAGQARHDEVARLVDKEEQTEKEKASTQSKIFPNTLISTPF